MGQAKRRGTREERVARAKYKALPWYKKLICNLKKRVDHAREVSTSCTKSQG